MRYLVLFLFCLNLFASPNDCILALSSQWFTKAVQKKEMASRLVDRFQLELKRMNLQKEWVEIIDYELVRESPVFHKFVVRTAGTTKEQIVSFPVMRSLKNQFKANQLISYQFKTEETFKFFYQKVTAKLKQKKLTDKNLVLVDLVWKHNGDYQLHLQPWNKIQGHDVWIIISGQ